MAQQAARHIAAALGRAKIVDSAAGRARGDSQSVTRAGISLMATAVVAGLLSGCTTATEVMTPVAEAQPATVLPDTINVTPTAARAIAATGEAVAVVGETAAEGARTVTAPVMSLASTAAGSAAAALDGVAGEVSADRAKLDRLIAAYADHYEVPVELVRRVVKRESNFRPGARNGPYWGLMQIRHDTARGMGYNGSPSGLLDAETNLKYAVRYLRGAYMVARGNHDQAVRFYARGYYYDAKRAGLLDETGLGRDRRRSR